MVMSSTNLFEDHPVSVELLGSSSDFLYVQRDDKAESCELPDFPEQRDQSLTVEHSQLSCGE